MGSLDPHWLTIELDSIDATIENWSPALWISFEATLQTLLSNEIPLGQFADRELNEIAASLR